MAVSSGTKQLCDRCRGELSRDALVCEHCHKLTHSERLEQLAATALAFEQNGEFIVARSEYLKMLPLLPDGSSQAHWTSNRAAGLELDEATRRQTPEGSTSKAHWVKRLGPLAPLALLIIKGKALLVLLKLNFILSLAAFMAVYWGLYGARFGIGFALLVLLHELGHYIEIRRRGLPADMPIFLPGLGAYVRWQALGVSQEVRAVISLAGPFAGLLGTIICALLWWKTGNGLWTALARASAWLNILNLIPIWILDGSQSALALGRNQRLLLVVSSLALWWIFDERLLILVAVGAGWRLFTKDLPADSSCRVAFYFIALLVALTLMLRLLPDISPVR